jgi:hypothetical protein
MNRFIVILVCLLLASCSTEYSRHKKAEMPAQLTFYQVENRAGQLRLFWQESPYPSDNMMRVETPLMDCDSVALYINPTPDNPRHLGMAALKVAPQRLASGEVELAQWSSLPGEHCTVLLTAGYVMDETFMGLSFSTREGVFLRRELRLSIAKPPGTSAGGPQRKLEDPGDWHIPDEWRRRTLTVSFDFPNGRREETTLSLEEVGHLLHGPYYLDDAYHRRWPWKTARFWVRGALAKLDLDFREAANREDRYAARRLESVGGVSGDWVLDTRDGRGPTNVLSVPVDEARYLRLRVQ